MFKEEIWKDIPNYQGYQASNLGRIRSLDRLGKDGRKLKGKILKQNKINDKGYLAVGINGKSKQVHRLILMTFNPVENMEKLQCDHIDFNTQNNCLDNLQWLTPEENDRKKRGTNWKRVLCVETGVIYPSISEAAGQTGLAASNISNCCNGKLKTTGGFHWKFI